MDAQDILLYQSQLKEYFLKTRLYRNADDMVLNALIDYIETEIYELIRDNSREKYDCVYEYHDLNKLEEVSNLLLPQNRLGSPNASTNNKLSDNLDFYVGYVGSDFHPLSEKQLKKNKNKDKQKQGKYTNSTTSTQPQPQQPEPKEYDKMEGAKHEDTVVRYERDRGNRKDCIAHYGYVCQVCGMNFEETYGELGKDFIEVHHLHPVSQGVRPVNPIEDLIPLCSNCHSMIHRQEDVSDWKGLKAKMEQCKQQNN